MGFKVYWYYSTKVGEFDIQFRHKCISDYKFFPCQNLTNGKKVPESDKREGTKGFSIVFSIHIIFITRLVCTYSCLYA